MGVIPDGEGLQRGGTSCDEEIRASPVLSPGRPMNGYRCPSLWPIDTHKRDATLSASP